MKAEHKINLKRVLKKITISLKDIPFNSLIESLSGYKVLPFKPKNKKDKKLLETLKTIATKVGKTINKNGIVSSRPNEAGNSIETFVIDAFKKCGLSANIPKCKSGKKKATGYPDIEFVDGYGRINYLECKTYNINTLDSNMRSFYLSPSKSFKITKNAHHFILSFEIFVDGRKRNKNIYKCKKWKIMSLHKLLVNVKHEFNSNNKKLYSKNLILAEGDL